MPSANPSRRRAQKSEQSTSQEILQTIIQDLEGVAKLHQMQGQLLHEVIREAKKLQRE